MMMKKTALILLIAVIFAALNLPALAAAHLVEDGKGPVDPLSYDEAGLAHLSLDCASEFECRQANSRAVFFYNCFYDLKSAQCQCSQGNFSECNTSRSSLDAKQLAAMGKGTTFIGAVKLVLEKLGSLPLLARLAAAAIVITAVIAALLRLRDNPENNFRKAKLLHQEASELHEKGDEDKAKLLFEKANYHREKAYEQQQKGLN